MFAAQNECVRSTEGSNAEKTVWGAARTQGAVSSGARRRFGGVLQAYVSAPGRGKKGTRFCQFPFFFVFLAAGNPIHLYRGNRPFFSSW